MTDLAIPAWAVVVYAVVWFAVEGARWAWTWLIGRRTTAAAAAVPSRVTNHLAYSQEPSVEAAAHRLGQAASRAVVLPPLPTAEIAARVTESASTALKTEVVQLLKADLAPDKLAREVTVGLTATLGGIIEAKVDASLTKMEAAMETRLMNLERSLAPRIVKAVKAKVQEDQELVANAAAEDAAALVPGGSLVESVAIAAETLVPGSRLAALAQRRKDLAPLIELVLPGLSELGRR